MLSFCISFQIKPINHQQYLHFFKCHPHSLNTLYHLLKLSHTATILVIYAISLLLLWLPLLVFQCQIFNIPLSNQLRTNTTPAEILTEISAPYTQVAFPSLDLSPTSPSPSNSCHLYFQQSCTSSHPSPVMWGKPAMLIFCWSWFCSIIYYIIRFTSLCIFRCQVHHWNSTGATKHWQWRTWHRKAFAKN